MIVRAAHEVAMIGRLDRASPVDKFRYILHSGQCESCRETPAWFGPCPVGGIVTRRSSKRVLCRSCLVERWNMATRWPLKTILINQSIPG